MAFGRTRLAPTRPEAGAAVGIFWVGGAAEVPTRRRSPTLNGVCAAGRPPAGFMATGWLSWLGDSPAGPLATSGAPNPREADQPSGARPYPRKAWTSRPGRRAGEGRRYSASRARAIPTGLRLAESHIGVGENSEGPLEDGLLDALQHERVVAEADSALRLVQRGARGPCPWQAHQHECEPGELVDAHGSVAHPLDRAPVGADTRWRVLRPSHGVAAPVRAIVGAPRRRRYSSCVSGLGSTPSSRRAARCGRRGTGGGQARAPPTPGRPASARLVLPR